MYADLKASSVKQPVNQVSPPYCISFYVVKFLEFACIVNNKYGMPKEATTEHIECRLSCTSVVIHSMVESA